MGKQILRILAVLLAVYPIVALAQAPKDGVYITDEEIKAVLKHSADIHRTIPDNTIRVIDMGQYQLGVAVVQRGAKPVRISSPDHRERIPEVERPSLISDITQHADTLAISDLEKDLATKLEVIALLVYRE